MDDNIDTIKKRLKTFNEATAPVVDHYQKKGKLVKIPAEGTVDESMLLQRTALKRYKLNLVFAEVTKHLDKAVQNK